jgi:putative chitobiose transport system permease protein
MSTIGGLRAPPNLRAHRAWTPWLFLAPALCVLGVFFLGSAVQVVYYSTTRYSAFTDPEFVGLDNYAALVADPVFWRAIANSFIYLLVTPALIILSLSAAMVIDSGIRGGKPLRILLFLPVVTPTIVAAIAWRLVLNEDNGLLNQALALSIGWTGLDTGIRWLTEHPFTLISAMMVTAWKGFGFYMMIFLAGLMQVPASTKEAAAIDGAGPVGTFLNVTLPSLRPTIALVLVISSISALKVFDELFVTVRGVPVDQQTAVPYIYDLAFEQGAFGAACAAGVILFAIILVFSLINLRLSSGGKA